LGGRAVNRGSPPLWRTIPEYNKFMEILSYIWTFYLYIPLFNFLIWLYLNYSMFNLGIAVIVLTIILRFSLLPFTILSERGKLISQRLKRDVGEINRDFSHDPVKRKIMIRQLLKKKKIRPWAKVVVLGVQFLVLILLYRVFLGGINTEQKFHLLYPSISKPDFINTKFLFFDIGVPNLILPAIVAGYIFGQILIHYWSTANKMSKKEQVYSLLFPALTFLILVLLPSVKSVFILTSLIFSSIISMFTVIIKLFLKTAKKPQKS